MGIFSSKKKIYVASVTYNMSGDYPDRMNYMKTATVGSILGAGNSPYVGESISNALLNGPYSGQRNLLRWSKTNYKDGIPKAFFGNTATLDITVVNNYLYEWHGSQLINAESAEAGPAQAYWWAYQWVLANRPYIERSQWSYDILDNSPTNPRVVVQLDDGTLHTVPMTGYIQTANYAYIRYTPLHIEEINGFPTTMIDEPQIHIYRFGSGNAIMEAIRPPESVYGGEFMPFMPIRIDNKFIDHPWYKAKYYEKCRKFYKKASGGKHIDDLIKELAKNEKLGDIDYAYMIYGVALNTKTHSCKRYLFEFMKTLMDRQTVTTQAYNKWIEDVGKSMVQYREIQRLYAEINKPDRGEGGDRGDRGRMAMASPRMSARANGEGGGGGPEQEGLWQAYERALWEFRSANPGGVPYNTISQRSDWLPNDFQINHMWVSNQSTLLTGINNPGKKVGEVWIERRPVLVIPTPEINFRREPGGGSEIEYSSGEERIPVFDIFRQVSVGAAERIRVTGLTQQNIVYQGKDVWVDAEKALKDPDECDLVLPIHMPTLKKLSLKDRCQIGVENTYIVFNCYEVVKIKWYQRGIFKLIFAIVIAIASVIFAPAGAFGAGILGSNMALGMSMGFAAGALTTAIAGAIVNAIAAMLVTTMLQKVSETLFKGILGAILSIALGFAIGQFGNMMSGTFSVDWGSMLSPKNLLNMTQAVTKGVTGYFAGQMQNIQNTMQSEAAEYKDALKEIQDKLQALLGTNSSAYLNPLWFTGDAQLLNESSQTFLDRTLLTGSDIVGLNRAMVEDYVSTNLELAKAYT